MSAGRMCRHLARPLVTLLALGIASALHAQVMPDDAPGYTQSDFGGVGLLQTPTARMAAPGELSLVVTHVQPYTHLNVSLQPLPWLEATFRYTKVSNRLYGAAIAGNQSYKDKSIDVKLHLLQESHYLPEVAVGIRDLGGTGLFSSEYLVGSKRLGDFDVSLGVAWGYMGARGDLANPLGWLDSRFKTRPSRVDQSATGGQFNSKSYFRGRMGVIGGVEYRTPLHWLRLKLELDGNNYQHEPLNNNQRQRSPINFAALFRVSRHIDMSLGYERGNTLMASINLHENLATQTPTSKVFDPPPEPLRDPATPAAGEPVAKAPTRVAWAEVSKVLAKNAGVQVSRIGRRGSELVVHGEEQRYFYPAQALGRTARILDNRLDPSIDWITLATEKHGLPVVESSLHRPRFDALLRHDIDLASFRRSVEQDPPGQQREQVLYTAPVKHWEASVQPAYVQSLGGPNAFVLYQVSLEGDARWNFNRHWWLDGTLNYNLLNNYGGYHYDATSLLPRVRTYVREYLVTSDLTMPNLQLTGTRMLGRDLYGMAYAGMLESMFGGVGGEVLYRPFGQSWALGMDANWVRQRGFRQDFSFRAYHVVTGQATLYLDTGIEGMHVAFSAGRYLAGDWGGTLDVFREFRNGVRMGAYATVTNKSGRQYGEGSFDKGIYFSIPFDLLLPRSSRSRATVLWQPLLRDGGARLNRRYDLYDMTEDRNGDLFEQNLDAITR